MKNKKIWLVIPVVVLVFGMSVVGCATNKAEPTKFDGKWLSLTDVNSNGFSDFSFTFTGNRWSFKSTGNSDPNQNASFSGTFTFTDTAITFKFGNITWEQGYTLNGNVLTLEEATTVEFPFGDFTKQ